jgi:hypothetical protein
MARRPGHVPQKGDGATSSSMAASAQNEGDRFFTIAGIQGRSSATDLKIRRHGEDTLKTNLDGDVERPGRSAGIERVFGESE